MLDLRQYLPKSHPLKATFRQHRIPQILLSNFLRDRLRIRVSQPQVAQWLNGYSKIPEHVETELQTLADQISSAGGVM